jgi:hypothetical protein
MVILALRRATQTLAGPLAFHLSPSLTPLFLIPHTSTATKNLVKLNNNASYNNCYKYFATSPHPVPQSTLKIREELHSKFIDEGKEIGVVWNGGRGRGKLPYSNLRS